MYKSLRISGGGKGLLWSGELEKGEIANGQFIKQNKIWISAPTNSLGQGEHQFHSHSSPGTALPLKHKGRALRPTLNLREKGAIRKRFLEKISPKF